MNLRLKTKPLGLKQRFPKRPDYLRAVRGRRGGYAPCINMLRARFDLNVQTGELRWRPVPKSHSDHVRWNKRFAGKEAGSFHRDGYRVVTLDDRQHKAHQVVWAIVKGVWPSLPIDHINGNRSDNRPANLREVCPKLQARNRKKPKDNTSGYIGVSPNGYGKWIAHISTDSGRKYLGTFRCVTAAAVARQRAQATDQTYHNNHGREDAAQEDSALSKWF